MRFHFCFLNYSKWETIEKGEVYFVDRKTGMRLGNGKYANYEIQERSCQVCGKKQIREERSSL